MIKQVYKRIILFLKETDKKNNAKESLDLLLKLILVDKTTIESLELKRNFDLEFDKIISLRQKENNHTNKAIENYFCAKRLKTIRKK